MTNLQYLRIYPDAIDSAIDSAENAMNFCGLGDYTYIDDMNEEAFSNLNYLGSFENITNSIISAYFSTAAAFIEKYATKKYKVDYYINCSDSDFYVDGVAM